jgi:hypothetical protein
MTEQSFGMRVLWRACAATLAIGLLAAAKMKDADLELLTDWFGGVYDVAGPAAGANAAAGRNELLVLRVSAPMVGWHVFYVEEHSADGALVSQQLMSFDIAEDKKSIIQIAFSFKEPRRWESGQLSPDIFKAVIVDDLVPANGCEIYWFHEGPAFAGNGGPYACRLRPRASGEAPQIDFRTRLTPVQFVFGSRVFNRRSGS